jgi:hypothetical protein
VFTQRMHRIPRLFVGLAALSVLVFALGPVSGVRAQTPAGSAPDWSKFGFSTVAGSVMYTPGTATSVTAAGQKVALPADFYSKPVKFELLTGNPASFAPNAGGRSVLLAFAFRVTDTSTNQLVGKFDKPAQWSYTASEVTAQSAVYDVSASATPTVVPNSVSPGTVTGTTLAHPFILDTVGWLVTNPAAASGAAAATTASAAGQAQLPSTGTGGLLDTPQNGLSASVLAVIAITSALLAAGGAYVLRRRLI